MSWQQRILDHGSEPVGAVEDFFAEQTASWPLLQAGVEGLGHASSRGVRVEGYDLIAWHIPHRIRSTTAEVDDRSIRERACFLCPENLPVEERALSLNDGFVVTCNPFPILGRHLSIVSCEHRPQRIAEAGAPDFATLLELARILPGFLVLYNGPECGASAPDHMHFQACSRERVSVLSHLGEVDGGVLKGFPSNPFVLRGGDAGRIEWKFEQLMGRLTAELPGTNEPMVNIVAVHEAGRWNVLVFPRTRHRPEMYHSGQLLWSPGALDLAGIIVLPLASDLDRATPEVLSQGFSEVSLPADAVIRIARELELQ